MSENNANGNFAQMFETSLKGPKHLEPGQKVEAVVVSIGKDWLFLDLGGKSEGSLAKREVTDENGNLTVQVGDSITAYFLSAGKNGMLFTISLSGGAAAVTHLEEAHRNKIPVEGLIAKEIKGGYEVTIGGSVRGFCPYSQMDIRRVEKSDEYLGRHETFLITEFSEKGRNIVMSRRLLLEEERRQQKEALRLTLEEGQAVHGTITSVRDFGAFVDIGGIEGLLPVSEIGWGRVEDVHAILEVGQEVEVVILKLDWEKDRFSFSLKATLPDPWERAAMKFPERSSHHGKIIRLTNFGAFVELEPGVDGLLHISKLAGGRRINHPREVVQVGQEVEVRIEKFDPEEKRISLALAAVEQEESEKTAEKDYTNYMKKSRSAASQPMGTLGDLFKKKMDTKKK